MLAVIVDALHTGLLAAQKQQRVSREKQSRDMTHAREQQLDPADLAHAGRMLACVLAGVKACWIVDSPLLTAVPHAVLTDILANIVVHMQSSGTAFGCDAAPSLSLLSIDDERAPFPDVVFAVINVPRLSSHLHAVTASTSSALRLIDVSPDLQAPVLCGIGSSAEQQVLSFITRLRSALPIMDPGSLPGCTAIHLQFAGDFNIAAIVGILLEYPVIYFSQRPNTSTNCLSHVPLCLYSLRVQSQEITGSGVTKRADQGTGQQQTLVTSFSIPSEFSPECADLVQRWCNDMRERTALASACTGIRFAAPDVTMTTHDTIMI